MSDIISSLQNTRIKNLVKLQEKSQERRKQNLFVVEGVKEFEKLIKGGYDIESLYYCKPLLKEVSLEELGDLPKFEVSEAVFAKIAYREDSGGLVALVKTPERTLTSLELSKNPLIIILESVEKPGNLGAVLRTADGAGADAVIVCDPKTDIWNPNVIRSSLGCSFSVPAVAASTEETISFLRDKGIKIYAAALPGSVRYDTPSYTDPAALVFGTEADGLSQLWLNEADQVIKIPMLGEADSLNVSNSVAIIVYEAQRQRGFKNPLNQ